MTRTGLASAFSLAILCCSTLRETLAQDTENPENTAPRLEESIWRADIGGGFAKYAKAAEVKLSRGFGTHGLGSAVRHDLWLTQIQGGLMLTEPLAAGHWYSGNLEGIGLLAAAGQENPEAAYFTGLNLGLRYHFNTRTRIVPFVGGSAGIGLTDIDRPDLSGRFQFNEQFGAGARYFFTRSHALVLDYALLHVSNAGIERPNRGVNAHLLSLGVSWMF